MDTDTSRRYLAASYDITPCEEGDAAYIESALRRSDDAHARPKRGVEEERLVLLIRDDSGMAVAGCIERIDAWGVAAIDTVWVDKRLRRKGMGTALVAEAERLALSKGCYLSIVGVFDFQPIEFFERLGYTLFNMWEDYPAGHANYSLAKRLHKKRSSTPPPYEVVQAEEEEGDFVEDRLAESIRSRLPSAHPYIPVDKKIVDKDGAVVAGCVAGVAGCDVAFLDLLWVDPAHRDQGLGGALLASVEREVREYGGTIVFVGAYDWQVEYLTRHGYVVTGTLADCPKGHTYYSLAKRL